VTPSDYWAGSQPSTWREYQDIISHVRAQYLATVQAAREQREATTGYAFDEFAAVERSAWHTYHEAGRRAWANYQASQQEQPPPVVTPGPLAAAARDEWLTRNQKRPNQPPPDSYPYPVPQSVVITDDLRHGQATFTPYPGTGAPGQSDQWPASFPAGSHHPGSGELNQFDERQETYLAADPETRDNH